MAEWTDFQRDETGAVRAPRVGFGGPSTPPPLLRRGVSALRTVTALSHRPPTIRPMCNHDFRASMKALPNFLAAATLALGLATPALAVDITGAGATFPYPIYAKWAEAYKQKTGIGMNYQSIGSGGGIAQIKAKTVDFGASDMPLKPDDLQAAGLMQFPAIIGGVVPVVNLEGITPGQLKFTGPVLADIYLGKIKSGMTGDRRPQSRREAARRRPSPSCIVRMARAPPSSGPTTCRR